MREASWLPSGPLLPGDTLEAGRTDARCSLRHPPLVASHHLCWLTLPRAGARVARGTGAPRAASTPDPSVPPPWRVSAAASAWPSPCRWSVWGVTMAAVRWCAVSRNYSTHDTRPAAAGYRPRPYRVWRPDVPPLPHADGWSG